MPLSGTSLVVVADWASPSLYKKQTFFDDNTQVAWEPVVGGANIVALNKVLEPYDVALGGGAWEGLYHLLLGRFSVRVGFCDSRGPAGSYVVKTRLERRVSLKRGGTVKVEDLQAVLAAVDNEQGRVLPGFWRHGLFGRLEAIRDEPAGSCSRRRSPSR